MTIKLLNNDKLLNIMKSKYCIMCVKNYLLKIIVCCSRNFAKQEFGKVESMLSYLGQDITTEKNNIFPFIFNIFFKKSRGKKLLNNLAKFSI